MTNKPFKVFANPMLDRFTASGEDRFVLRSNGKPVFSLDINDAADLIDALQKFLAVNA